jgi:hypothetical protein
VELKQIIANAARLFRSRKMHEWEIEGMDLCITGAAGIVEPETWNLACVYQVGTADRNKRSALPTGGARHGLVSTPHISMEFSEPVSLLLTYNTAFRG